MHAYEFLAYDDFSSAFTNVVPRRPNRHDVECNLDLLSALTGVSCEAGPLELVLSEESSARAREKLASLGLLPGALTVALCAGSSRWMSFKRWPIESAIILARRILCELDGVKVAVFFGPGEAEDSVVWRTAFPNGDPVVVENLPLTVYAAA